jgi:hypothetical protein
MVSYDLKAPLRSIDTLINGLLEDNKDIIWMRKPWNQ